MLHENYNSERIKQLIELHKEQLRFINSFYLPLLAAMAALLGVNNSMTLLWKLSNLFVGLIALFALTALKLDLKWKIENLINEIKS